jgi:hypothetical protein
MANTVTINPSGLNATRVVLTAATTFNILPGYDGQELAVIFQQDNTGSWVVTGGANITSFSAVVGTANHDTFETFGYDALLGQWVFLAKGNL